MTLIDALYYKVELNRTIRANHHDWDLVIHAIDCQQFGIFLQNKIGEIWLKKRYGLEYTKWLAS